MLEALQAYGVKPGKTIHFVDRSDRSARRLVLECYPATPSCCRVSYRDYESTHDRLSGAHTVQVSWRMFYFFNANTVYVHEVISLGHTPPVFPPKRDLKLLASGARKLPPDFSKATDAQITVLWRDLKVWARL